MSKQLSPKQQQALEAYKITINQAETDEQRKSVDLPSCLKKVFIDDCLFEFLSNDELAGNFNTYCNFTVRIIEKINRETKQKQVEVLFSEPFKNGAKYNFNFDSLPEHNKILVILSLLSRTPEDKAIIPFLDVPFKSKEGKKLSFTLQDNMLSNFAGSCFGQGKGQRKALLEITKTYIDQLYL